MTETPKYVVLQKQDQFELRHYPLMLQAEVRMSGSNYRSAAERAFQVLASYIFGNNQSRQSIDMTSPVSAVRSEKIAMTSPVIISGESEFTVAFIMPAKYTQNDLPMPNDQRIAIRAIDEHDVAAVRFNSFFNENKIAENKIKLASWVQKIGYVNDGDYIIAGYNPPWVPGFLSRNEVMVPVIKAQLENRS